MDVALKRLGLATDIKIFLIVCIYLDTKFPLLLSLMRTE